ncbi:MAG: TIGR02281 family clan AA aspartic protease, partial [Sphingomonas sp.]
MRMIPESIADIPLYLAIPAALIALMVLRRIPVIGPLVNLATWGLIGLALYVAIDQRSRLDPYLGPVADWLRPQRQEVVGTELRVRMAQDGHFWVT